MALRFCQLNGYTGVSSIETHNQGGTCAVFHRSGSGRRIDGGHGTKIRKIVCSGGHVDPPVLTCMDDGNGAVYVSALRSGGAAAQAGLLLGERVLSVNGAAAATHAQATTALRATTWMKPCPWSWTNWDSAEAWERRDTANITCAAHEFSGSAGLDNWHVRSLS